MDADTGRASARALVREDVFELVRAAGELTRGELVERSGLPRSTVHNVVARLLAEGRVVEARPEDKGPGSGRGRPGTKLRAVPRGAHVGAIDFGHSHITVAVADALGGLVAQERLEFGVDLAADEALDLAATALLGLRDRLGVTHLSRVVAGVPGPLDRRTGEVRSATILSGWVGRAPQRELGERLGVPVRAENDAYLGAYGERKCGVGHDVDDFIYVKASHGIGACPVIDGEPYRGATGLAGEIGHTHLPGRTELCRCGNRGCLEAVVSVDTVREQIAHSHPGTDGATARLSTFDDPVSERILSEAGWVIGEVLADMCNLLNPEAVVLGGELGTAGPALVDGVAAAIRRHAQPATADALRVVAATTGVDAELMGALQLAATTTNR